MSKSKPKKAPTKAELIRKKQTYDALDAQIAKARKSLETLNDKKREVAEEYDDLSSFFAEWEELGGFLKRVPAPGKGEVTELNLTVDQDDTRYQLCLNAPGATILIEEIWPKVYKVLKEAAK